MKKRPVTPRGRQNVRVNPFDVVGTWLGSAVQWALDLVQTVGPVWGALIAGLAILCECTLFIGLVVPGDTIVVAAATGVRSPLHFAVLFAVVVVATLGGQSIGFVLGRWTGPALRRSRLGARLGGRWDRAAAFVARRGGWAVLISRFLPVLHAVMPVTVGMSAMRYRRFILWATPAAIVWSALYVGVGAAAAGSFRALEGELHVAGYLFAGMLLGGAILAFVGKHVLARAAEEDARIAAEGAAESAPRAAPAVDPPPLPESPPVLGTGPAPTGRMEGDEPAA